MSIGTLVVDAEQSVTLTGSADGRYDRQLDGLLFTPGETIHVAASGDTAAAFDTTISAPQTITVTSGPPLLQSRGQALVIDWIPVSSTLVDLTVSARSTTFGPDSLITCECPGEVGHAAFSASMLSMFEPGPVRLSGHAVTRGSVDDAYATQLTVTTGIVDADGTGKVSRRARVRTTTAGARALPCRCCR